MNQKLEILFKNNTFILNEIKEKLNEKQFIDFSANSLDHYNIDSNNINFKLKSESIDYNKIRNLLELLVDYKSKKMVESNFKLGILFGFYNFINLIRIFNITPTVKTKSNIKQQKYNVIKSNYCSRNTFLYYDLFNDLLEKMKKDKLTIALKVPFKKNEKNISDGYVIIDYYKGISIYQLELILIHNVYQIYVSNLLINFYYIIRNLLNFLDFNMDYCYKVENNLLKKIDVICEVFSNDSRNNSEIYINYENKFSNYTSNTLFVSLYIKLMGDRKKAKAYATFSN